MHVGERVRILVGITPPLNGSPIVMAQVDIIGDGRSGWAVTGDVGNTAAIRVTPQVAGNFEWVAAVTTSEGCTAATGARRAVQVVK